jgi:hypothetical protein
MPGRSKRHDNVATVEMVTKTPGPGHADTETGRVRTMVVTTEHNALQSARNAAIAESTSRAGIFMGAVSAGLIALSLTLTVGHERTAIYILSLVVLSTLAFMGFATFDRVLRSGIEAAQCGERIVRLRAYYFDIAPELTHYLASLPSSRHRSIRGPESGRWPFYRTVAGLIGTVSAVLTGLAAGTIAEILFGSSVLRGWVTAGVVGVAVLAGLIWFHDRVWRQARRERLFDDEQDQQEAG